MLQAVEWKRPFGRASKTVCLKASFIPFDADMVATGAQLRRLIGVPVLHTFWMECADLDSYKVSSYFSHLRYSAASEQWQKQMLYIAANL